MTTRSIPMRTQIKKYTILATPTPIYMVTVQKQGLLVPEVVLDVEQGNKTFVEMYDEAVTWAEAH